VTGGIAGISLSRVRAAPWPGGQITGQMVSAAVDLARDAGRWLLLARSWS
jgi:hypothetical protein